MAVDDGMAKAVAVWENAAVAARMDKAALRSIWVSCSRSDGHTV